MIIAGHANICNDDGGVGAPGGSGSGSSSGERASSERRPAEHLNMVSSDENEWWSSPNGTLESGPGDRLAGARIGSGLKVSE